MPSNSSLITSWTTRTRRARTSFVVPSGSHSRALTKACPGNSSVSSPRPRVIKHLHGLWKGTSFSSRKCQLASDPRVSSTISIPGVPGVTLASTTKPGPPSSPAPSSLIFSPPSPTTPDSLPSGVDTDSNPIKFSEVEPRGVLSLPYSGAPAAPESPYCRHPVSLPLPLPPSLSLPGHSLLPPRGTSGTSLAETGCSTSGYYTLDAATRLQDFRLLIDELRVTYLHHDSKEEFDTGNCEHGDNDSDDDSDDDGREHLLWLLEDVMQKVQQLVENDLPRLGGLGHLSHYDRHYSSGLTSLEGMSK